MIYISIECGTIEMGKWLNENIGPPLYETRYSISGEFWEYRYEDGKTLAFYRNEDVLAFKLRFEL